MQASDIRNLLNSFIEEVWNNNGPEKVPTYLDTNFTVHLLGGKKEGIGLEWVKNNVRTAHQKFDNLKICVEDTDVENNKIVSRMLLSAKLNGAEVTSREFMLHIVKDGKFIEAWSLGSNWD